MSWRTARFVSLAVHGALAARAARAARATVIAFIRRRLPAGSDDAISDDELAASNATRVSREPFAPYAAVISPADSR